MKHAEPDSNHAKFFERPDFFDERFGEINKASKFSGKGDREIWAAFKNGNRLAFIHIYNTYFDELYSFARQFTNDLELIKDAIQDVFVRLNESRERLSDTENIKFYLFKSVKREVIFSFRQKRNSENRLAAIKGLGFEYEASIEESLISLQDHEETIKRIRDAANNLNERQREIVFYHFFEGFTVKQIQELMKLGSIQATYNLLNRALNQLRNVLSTMATLWPLSIFDFIK